jgi:hypothetical protein
LPLLADLQDELAVHGELQQLPVALAVAGEPDEIVVVDEDAVLACGPLIALPRSAPVADQVAGLVEHQHGRSGDTASRFRRVLLRRAFTRGERSRPMHHPDAIIFVGGDAGDLPKQPVVGQRLGPERLDLELRHGGGVLRRRGCGGEGHRGAKADCAKPRAHHFHLFPPGRAEGGIRCNRTHGRALPWIAD